MNNNAHDDDYRFYPAPKNTSDRLLDVVAITGGILILAATILSVFL